LHDPNFNRVVGFTRVGDGQTDGWTDGPYPLMLSRAKTEY